MQQAYLQRQALFFRHEYKFFKLRFHTTIQYHHHVFLISCLTVKAIHGSYI